MENEKDKLSFFDDAGKVSNIVIGIIVITLILSQSFAINNNLTTSQIFGSVINYTILYILVLVYFISIKFNFGKKYFNYFNLFLIILYFIKALSSFLTLFQSLSLNSLLGFGIDIVFFLYLFHTMLRSTRIWKDYKLSNSPFNELSNDFYFEFIFIVSSVLLAVDLIASTAFNGSIVCILDYLFLVFFARYVYLYRNYLDEKKVNINNIGNFDEIKKEVTESIDEIKEDIVEETNNIKNDINNLITDNHIDTKVEEAKNSFISSTEKLKDGLNKYIDENHLDEKVEKAKEEVIEVVKETKKDVEKIIEDNKIDEKLDEVKEKVIEETKDTKKKVDNYIKEKKENSSDKVIDSTKSSKKNNYVKKDYKKYNHNDNKERKYNKKNNIKKEDGE